jgi:hypothetical protein
MNDSLLEKGEASGTAIPAPEEDRLQLFDTALIE